MKRTSRLVLHGILGFGLLSGGGTLVQAQSDILWIVVDGASRDDLSRNFGAWVAAEGGYNVDFAPDVGFDANTTGDSISESQMTLLNSYDLIVVPRSGHGSSAAKSSLDWNTVTTSLLLMTPFLAGEDQPRDNWRWVPTGTETPTTPEIQDMVVADPASSIFNGVDTSGGAVRIYESPDTTMQLEVDSSVFTGQVAGWTDRVDGEGGNLNYPWAVLWDGTESAFYDGGSEAPGGRRTLFPGELTMNPDLLTADGQQVLLNTIESTIPEPGTYALLAGIGALGGVLLLRRRRLAKRD